MTIDTALALDYPARLSVIGCGGKTSLVDLLARTHNKQKVLIMTTTKIRPPKETGVLLCDTVQQCLAHTPQPGIQCLGVTHEATGKFSSPPEEYWPQLVQEYDLVLMEADGSRSLPCKGWGGHEPVIPRFTTHTVGVVTLLGQGKPADESTVLRLPEFCRLTGLSPGETIGLQALTDMIGAPDGMFKNAVGRKILFINQIEDLASLETAKKLAAMVRQQYPGLLDTIFAGSVFENNSHMV